MKVSSKLYIEGSADSFIASSFWSGETLLQMIYSGVFTELFTPVLLNITGEEPRALMLSDAPSLLQELIGHADNTFVDVFSWQG